jgi:hypothetical protein
MIFSNYHNDDSSLGDSADKARNGSHLLLEVLFTASASTRVLALVVKKTSSKSVE